MTRRILTLTFGSIFKTKDGIIGVHINLRMSLSRIRN